MDPRYARSRNALRAAVLAIGATTRLSQITVADVCREAGVTRDTFYRHAPTAAVMLADALGAELERMTPAQRARIASTGREGFERAERALLEHVAARAAVYRNAMEPVLPAVLRAQLEGIVRHLLVAYLEHHPGLAPDDVDAEDADELDIVASYAASGTIGAIERWLAGDELDVDRGVRLIIAASPEFWFAEGRTPLSDTRQIEA